ncbi:hypothetical protein [Halodesulfovibrio spirochaetisodalis]|uniref:Uncharacterized protein n=1 Tax=Halodesulfovibrio spirochaetisodalis TaxID=1560234 RepID=A0A1B7XBC2_9BACT|nr:hypothetical protein [Halodesulfovibrio spirochaetisodalis]OBQ46636.1 hypothetical protein SP90_11605 [Halodesulfovibrio spirochaetisodalis]
MRQETIIAIVFVIAALIFSAVTYSFAHRSMVIDSTSATIITIPGGGHVAPVSSTFGTYHRGMLPQGAYLPPERIHVLYTGPPRMRVTSYGYAYHRPGRIYSVHFMHR